jgi:hypothetical protein
VTVTPGDPRDPQLADLLAILWRQRLLVAGVVVITMGVVAVLAAVTPPTFRLSSVVEVQRDASDSSDGIDHVITRTNNGSLVNAVLPASLGRGLDIRAEFRQPLSLELSVRTTDAQQGRSALDLYTRAIATELQRAGDSKRARVLEEIQRNELVLQSMRAMRERIVSLLDALKRDRRALGALCAGTAPSESVDGRGAPDLRADVQRRDLDLRAAALAQMLDTEVEITTRRVSLDIERARRELDRLRPPTIVQLSELSSPIAPRLRFNLVVAFIGGTLIAAVVAFLRESRGSLVPPSRKA